MHPSDLLGNLTRAIGAVWDAIGAPIVAIGRTIGTGPLPLVLITIAAGAALGVGIVRHFDR